MDAELIFWVVALAVGLLAFGGLWYMAKREARNYVSWVADGDWK